MLKLTPRNMAVAAMIAALYFALGIAFAPIGFGPVQVRVAEALCMLCVFSPVAVWGVAIGCALTNAYGFISGASTILGPIDIVLGSAATLIAGYMSWRLRDWRMADLPLASVLPPVLLNAAVVGGELAFAISGGLWNGTHLLFGLEVGLGQLIACGVFGIILVRTLEKTGMGEHLFRSIQLQ